MKILGRTMLGLWMIIGVAWGVQSEPKRYRAWKNQPSERFSDAEANFKKVQKLLLTQYHDAKLTEEQLYQAATDGMLRALNEKDEEPWNKLITPTELSELQNDLKGEVTGIGVEIKFDSGTGISSVIGLIPGSAAEKAGVQIGDQIISVNGKIYKGLQFRDVVYEIRGKVGESVRLKLLRGDDIVSKKIKREKIAWSPVETAMLENQVGWIAIGYFTEVTPRLLKEALEKMKKEGAKSLVLDLRGNTGGLFDQAVESAGFFLPKDSVVVRVQGRGGKEEIIKSKGEPLVQGLPVVVLVDDETASGAELFAASLVDNLGAKLVGKRTCGKWNAQTMENLSNRYAVKFTTKLFRSPKNKTYQGVGMEPDVLVGEEGGARTSTLRAKDPLASDAQLRAAYSLLGAVR